MDAVCCPVSPTDYHRRQLARLHSATDICSRTMNRKPGFTLFLVLASPAGQTKSPRPKRDGGATCTPAVPPSLTEPAPLPAGELLGSIHLDRYGMRLAHPISRSLITAEFPAPPTWLKPFGARLPGPFRIHLCAGLSPARRLSGHRPDAYSSRSSSLDDSLAAHATSAAAFCQQTHLCFRHPERNAAESKDLVALARTVDPW